MLVFLGCAIVIALIGGSALKNWGNESGQSDPPITASSEFKERWKQERIRDKKVSKILRQIMLGGGVIGFILWVVFVQLTLSHKAVALFDKLAVLFMLLTVSCVVASPILVLGYEIFRNAKLKRQGFWNC